MNMSDSTMQTRRAIIAAALMVGAAAAAKVLTPKLVISSMHSQMKLEEIVPANFSYWKMDTLAAEASVVNPNLKEFLDQLYADQLSRIYTGPAGERVMLSLAYGRNQNRDLQVHKPEVCYVAQGFQLQDLKKVDLDTPFGILPAMHLVTRMGARNEPVTYWIRVGDKVIRGWLEQNINRIQVGLKGQIPDGLLVRVSTVQPDTEQAFAIQQRFLSDMLQAVAPEHRHMFIGQMSATGRA